MNRFKTKLLMALFFVGAAATNAGAANLTFVSGAAAYASRTNGVRVQCNFRLEGEIVLGDAERFQNFIAQHADAIDGDPEFQASPRIATLCLDSPGGAFNEALRIAELIRQDRPYPIGFGTPMITTRLQENASCESACAVIFMAGTLFFHETSSLPMRSMHPTARLGFHAPALVVAEGRYDEATVTRAYDLSTTLISELLRILNVGRSTSGRAYSGTGSWMNGRLLEAMLSTPASSMRYLETVDDAGFWRVAVYPTSKVVVGEENAHTACGNFFDWTDEKPASDFPLYPSYLPSTDWMQPVRKYVHQIGPEALIRCTVSVFSDGTYQVDPDLTAEHDDSFNSLALHDGSVPITSLTPEGVSVAGVSTQAQSAPSVPWSPRFGGQKITYWTHNGSKMAWESSGNRRWVWFFEPRADLQDAGAYPGMLLFEGVLERSSLEGTFYRVFKGCPGVISHDGYGSVSGEIVYFTGLYRVPRGNCEPGQMVEERLQFQYVGVSPFSGD